MSIRSNREKRNISQTQLAERVGITRAYLCQLEKGVKNNPSIRILMDIAKELDVPVETLISPNGAKHEQRCCN